jgi:hypothetical protein
MTCSPKPEHVNIDDHTLIDSIEAAYKTNELFNDGVSVDLSSDFIPDFERIAYEDSVSENNGLFNCRVSFNDRKEIVKIYSTDESESGDILTVLTAYFKSGNLIYIDFLNDVIPDPGLTYYIKSAVEDDQFVPGKYKAEKYVFSGKNADLPIDEASTECIFKALVLYDQMKAVFGKK